MTIALLVEVLVGILGAGGIAGGILAWVRFPSEKRRLVSDAHGEEADAAKAVTEAAIMLIKPFQDQVARLHDELNKAEEKLKKLQDAWDSERAISLHNSYVLTQENDVLVTRVQELEKRLK